MNKNTAKTTDPIWDSRNSDEPNITQQSITMEELEALSPHPLGKRARCSNCTCNNNMYNCRSDRHIPVTGIKL